LPAASVVREVLRHAVERDPRQQSQPGAVAVVVLLPLPAFDEQVGRHEGDRTGREADPRRQVAPRLERGLEELEGERGGECSTREGEQRGQEGPWERPPRTGQSARHQRGGGHDREDEAWAMGEA